MANIVTGITKYTTKKITDKAYRKKSLSSCFKNGKKYKKKNNI